MTTLRTVLGWIGAVAAVLLCSAVTAQAVGLSEVDAALSAARVDSDLEGAARGTAQATATPFVTSNAARPNDGLPTAAPVAPTPGPETTSAAPAPARTTEEPASEPPEPAPTDEASDPAAAPDPPPPSAVTGDAAAEAAVLTLVNAERVAAGCGPLRGEPTLATAARGHSADMKERDYFAHDTPEGVTPWDRAKAAGYDQPAAENIARGQPTPEAVVAAWMDSDGHRSNILDCRYQAMGTGMVTGSGGPWWTQMFGWV